MDLHGWSCVGAWYIVKESNARWSDKHSRPWLIIDDSGSGPILQAVPRSTSRPRSRGEIRHEKHDHAPGDPDERTCRIDKDGWVVRDRRRIPREWIEGSRSFSCYEPDESVLKAAGCRR